MTGVESVIRELKENVKSASFHVIHIVFLQRHETAYRRGQIPTVNQNYVVQSPALLTRHLSLSYFDAKQ
jgi:hypothetical protein